MRIKSFIAATVQEALKNVKREMGDASIILETRNIEEGDIKSRAGQTLVEVVAAENNNVQSKDKDLDQGEEQLGDRGDADMQSKDQHPPDLSRSDLQQSEQDPSTEHEDICDEHKDGIALTDHLHSDKLNESTATTPADRLDDFSETVQSRKLKKVSKWIVGSKVDRTLPHTDNNIKNEDKNSELLSSTLNQSGSSTSDRFTSRKYSTVKRRDNLSHREKDNTTLSDQLPADDLMEMAGYSADDISATLEPQQNSDSSGDWSEASKGLFKQLRVQQVEEEHSKLLINEARGRLSNDEYDKEGLNLQMLRGDIIQKIKISDSSLNDQKECKTMVFVGAAGTGKTTSILKLAYNKKKKSDKKIILISIRGHSAERLKKTADKIGATLRTVTSHSEIRDIIDKDEGSSHIFVDTPGMTYCDDYALSGIKGFLDEMPNKETHLVVSAATRYADIINIVNKFTLFPLDRLHFTKVDETCLYGTLLSVAMETQIPLSCFSDGQEVPEDLRHVSAEMVADMVLQAQ